MSEEVEEDIKPVAEESPKPPLNAPSRMKEYIADVDIHWPKDKYPDIKRTKVVKGPVKSYFWHKDGVKVAEVNEQPWQDPVTGGTDFIYISYLVRNNTAG